MPHRAARKSPGPLDPQGNAREGLRNRKPTGAVRPRTFEQEAELRALIKAGLERKGVVHCAVPIRSRWLEGTSHVGWRAGPGYYRSNGSGHRESVEAIHVDQGYIGETPASEAAAHGIHLILVKYPEGNPPLTTALYDCGG